MRILVCFVMALFAIAGFNEGLKLISSDGIWFWIGIVICAVLCLAIYLIVLIGFGPILKQIKKDKSVPKEPKN